MEYNTLGKKPMETNLKTRIEKNSGKILPEGYNNSRILTNQYLYFI